MMKTKVDYNPVQLRQSINEAGKHLFRQLDEFMSYPRVHFIVEDNDFGAAADMPAGAMLKGDKVLLTQLFGIGSDAVLWNEIARASDDRMPQEQIFFSKWVEETKKIILAARRNRFKAPQTVLIGRAGLRVRFLPYQARIQGDGRILL